MAGRRPTAKPPARTRHRANQCGEGINAGDKLSLLHLLSGFVSTHQMFEEIISPVRARYQIDMNGPRLGRRPFAGM